jgi:hypothetical protein
MLTNGSTAIECAGGLKAVGVGLAATVGDDTADFEIRSFPMAR